MKEGKAQQVMLKRRHVGHAGDEERERGREEEEERPAAAPSGAGPVRPDAKDRIDPTREDRGKRPEGGDLGIGRAVVLFQETAEADRVLKQNDHELIPHQPEKQDVELLLRICQRAYPEDLGSGTCRMVRSRGYSRGHEEGSFTGGETGCLRQRNSRRRRKRAFPGSRIVNAKPVPANNFGRSRTVCSSERPNWFLPSTKTLFFTSTTAAMQNAFTTPVGCGFSCLKARL